MGELEAGFLKGPAVNSTLFVIREWLMAPMITSLQVESGYHHSEPHLLDFLCPGLLLSPS